MNIKEKIEKSEANLQRKLDWVERHDSRIVFTTGIIIGMLGVLASAGAKIESCSTIIIWSFGLSTAFLFISLFFIYKSQYPKIQSQNTSLIYFGTISEMRCDEFKRKFLTYTDDDYLDDLLCQIHINAQILKSKFSNLKISLILLGIAIIPWLASIYFSYEFIK